MRLRLFSQLRYRLRARQGRTRKKSLTAPIEPFKPRPSLSAPPDRNEALLRSLRSRWELTKLVAPGGIAAELGIAKGVFSTLMLERSQLGYLYSVDMYAGKGHDIEQYRSALVRLEPYRDRNTILKMRFDEALPLFPDAYFDLVYVDGYASEGEEGGATLHDWFPKVKSGGIFAGHDYDPNWPFVVKAVDKLVAEHRLTLYTVGGDADPIDAANRYSSWFVFKP